MTGTKQLNTFLLAVALLLGIAADLFLKTGSWGLGFSAWGLLLLAAVAVVAWQYGTPLKREGLALAGLAACAAVFSGWRDALILSAVDVLAVLFCAALLLLKTGGYSLHRLPLSRALYGFFLQVFHAVAGAGILVFGDLRREPEATSRFRAALPIFRGLLFALPPLVVFSALLASADADFDYLVREILDIQFWEIVGHTFLIGSVTWLAAGLFRGKYVADEPAFSPNLRPKFLSVGTTEIVIVFGLLDLLFLAFMVLQLPYFFGSHTTVLGTPSLTYAEYARRGFYELLWVVAFALPLLLSADYLLRRESGGDVSLFRALGGMLVALLIGVLASALWRLRLYVERFGLTEDRLFACAVVLWLALVLFWLCATVLAGRRDRFLYGAVLSGYASLLLLNLINPHALVAELNLSRDPGGFDVAYHEKLSADAVPALVNGIDRLDPEARNELAWSLLSRYNRRTVADWRSWNASIASATTVVRRESQRLRGYLLPLKPQVEHQKKPCAGAAADTLCGTEKVRR